MSPVPCQRITILEILEDEWFKKDYKSLVFEVLERAWIATTDKEMVYDKLNSLSRDEFGRWACSADISETIKSAIMEYIQ